MTEILRPDICVIGAGSAGLTAAAAAAAFGVQVVLIERGDMGGECLNTGCVPSKALIAAAEHAHATRRAPLFGIRTSKAEVNFSAVHRHVRGVIDAIAPNDSEGRFTGLGVRVLRGTARFRDRRTVVVDEIEIRARRFIVATGSSPAVPPIDGIQDVPYLTSDTVFHLQRRPAHLLVVGGGPVGLELAQAFRRLGSQVTVFESGPALPRDDPEMTVVLLQLLRDQGIEIRENVKATRVARRSRGGLRLTLSDGSWADGSHILLATGRQPTVTGLGLELARIAYDKRGILVNRRMRTRNRRVYAVGDCADGPRFTHWASYQAGQVLRSILFRFGGRINQDLLPWVTCTDPELAHAGLSETEARRRHRQVRILRWPFSENDRAQADRATQGHVKIVTTRRGRVLGAEILGRHAGELIAVWAVAAASGLKVGAVLGTVLPYPTLSEAGKRAAVSFYTPALTGKLLRRAIRLLRFFG